MNVKMINTIKELVTPYNYNNESTDSIAIKAYKKYGIDTETTPTIKIVVGSQDIPKWSTVVRRIQLTKKNIRQKLKELTE